jgi:hypothetical protein
MNFECDAFISYSHIDNVELVDGSKGWVTNLHRALEIKLSQFMGEKPRIWRDPKLSGNDIFEITLIDQLKSVAVLVAVASPRYVKSDWTRRELTEFCKAADAQGGVRYRDKTRVFKVIKTPVPRDTDLPEFRQCLGYQFYKSDPETGRIHEFDVIFGPEAQAEFWMKLEDLAHDVCDLLQPLRAEFVGGDSSAAVVDTRESVYLAETTADLREAREAIRRDLQQHGYTVLPSQSLPLVADEMKAAIAECLSQCRMSIHPIGARYGFIPEGSDKSLTQIQNELAIERGKQGGFVRLLWIPPGEKFEDERQAALVDQLRTNPRMEHDADLLEAYLEDLRTVIYERLKKSAPVNAVVEEVKAERVVVPATNPPKTEGAPNVTANVAPNGSGKGNGNRNGLAAGQIYMIHDERDGTAVKPYGDFLFNQGFDVLRPLFKGDEAEVRQTNEENLRVCNGALIFYGATNELWVRRKVREIQKSVGYGRTDPLPATAILSIPPATDEKQQFRTHDCTVMTAGAEFNADVLAPFLSLMKPGGG